ncbi:medium-chain acyl-CoA ligase ACSF2, mitochondrial-like [Protopterus annectens]|uniref:medium-chain acyl-CoA ligase ACSF2, mitochondrial-like n=1 Tax=Protopterus annectens TaxID=7888 RepID=UPI001CFA5E4A|nr:medium-chain acyl-CoA ligase ACSF2, mitochondrial-like [Protopterus annectens]
MVSRVLQRWLASKAHLQTKKYLQASGLWPNKIQGFQISSAQYDERPPMSPILTTSYVHGACHIPLVSKTTGQCLEETTNRFPDREAVFFVKEGIRKTFQQLNKDVNQLAAGLLAIGLKKGDHLGMWGPNSYEWILLQFATAKAGIILVTVNPAYQSQELEYILKKAHMLKFILSNCERTRNVLSAFPSCDENSALCSSVSSISQATTHHLKLPELKAVIVLDSKLPGTFHFDEVMQAGSTSYMQQLQELQKTLSFDDPVCVQFTSGTTGKPKGVILTHHGTVNNARFIGIRLGYYWRVMRICIPVPLYHCFGTVAGGLMMGVFGATLIFSSPTFEGKAALEAIHKEKCTIIYGTTTMYIDMLSQPDFSKYDLSSLETGIIGASPVPKEIFKRIMTEMHCKELANIYGTTENSPSTFINFAKDEFRRKTETVGYIAPHTEAKIVDPITGLIVPLNTPGEVFIRGYCNMLGYWADPEKTKEAITADRWYKTGDLGILDEFGYLKIVGRCRDMVIRGGENIYPAEIEQFLHTHPKIQEAQVVGVKDERMGEEVCACLRIKEGEVVTADEIKAFCKGQISHFKIPRYVVFVKSYPMTASGKVQKYILAKEMEKHLGL